MRIVNQETLIPIGLAIVIIGSITTWVTGVRNELASHSEQLAALYKNHESDIKLNIEINSRLSRIEWGLEQRYVNERKNK